MNAVRKINSLLSSGAVTVERTGPTTQPRILKKLTTTPTTNNHQSQKCYICDEASTVQQQNYVLTEAVTSVTHTKLPNKIGQVVGDAFMVIVCVEDIICKKCLTIFNQMDRLESDLERVKNTILNFINKKYGITSDSDDLIKTNNVSAAPPAKMQKLNTGNTYINRKMVSEDDENPRKIQVTRQVINRGGVGGGDAVENQMNSMFESPERRNNTTTTTNAVHIVQQTQPSNKRGPIKIYKCMSCDFKTTDLKQFQPHYEQCKQLQNIQQPQQQQQVQVAQATTQIHTGFRCKLCKKLFATSVALRHHTAEKHPAEYTCNICNVNFVNEPNYKKHMETAHPDIKTIENRTIVTSIQSKNQLYACTLCQYKTPDKQNYDDHLRKHVKVKPFKCRICAARFETREQASIHAKGHQPDYFKCGSCSMSFPQREMLIKHFETHETKSKPQQQQQQQQPKALTTQKLLQETIDEALRDPIDHNEQAKQINFLSCNICSLTFLQEHYYIQHMETQHKKTIQPAGNNGNVSTSTVVTTNPQGQSLIRQDVRNTNATILNTQTNSISEDDLESIFEKMHSDKGDGEGANSNSGDNLVITTQENSGGGITFNITIPQQEGNELNLDQNQKIVSFFYFLIFFSYLIQFCEIARLRNNK